MYFYQRLRDLREDAGFSQKKIGQLLSTTQQQYARWESGKQEMPMHNFIILAKFYNVSLDYLAGLTDIPCTLDGTPYSFSTNVDVKNIANISTGTNINII